MDSEPMPDPATPGPRCGLPWEPDGAHGCPAGEREEERREAVIRERTAQATPGPWHGEAGEVWRRDEGPFLSWISTGDAWSRSYEEDRIEADAKFIAAAREDVPWLLDQLAAAQAALSEERAARQAAERRQARLREALALYAVDAWTGYDRTYRCWLCHATGEERETVKHRAECLLALGEEARSDDAD